MTISQTEVEPQIIELSAKGFGSFCDDISQMFGVDMSCNQLEHCAETVKNLKKRFEKLAAVISVKSEGVLEGTYQFIFDKRGLFTLSGVIIMLPEKGILDSAKYGSAEDAERMSDTIGEAGNLLTGSWDRVFREEFEGHGHFSQSNTFIGNPWDKPDEKIGLGNDEELLFVLHEMKIGSYPPFNCGVIFPRKIFAGASKSDTETTTAPAEKKEQEKTEENTSEQPAATEQSEPEESDEGRKSGVESKSQESTAKKASAEKKPETEKAISDVESIVKEQPEPAVKDKSDAGQIDVPSNDVEQEEAVSVNDIWEEKQKESISESIKRITDSPTNFPGGSVPVAGTICAKDIMQKKVIWASGDDSVQQALTKMEQLDSDYLIIGAAGVIEGIVSRSDLTGATSPYLRPMFANWRRPLDDATLQIKIKWTMSRPVSTVDPETQLPVIMENMCRLGHHCLPVVDRHSKVQGTITIFDIFSVLLRGNF